MRTTDHPRRPGLASSGNRVRPLRSARPVRRTTAAGLRSYILVPSRTLIPGLNRPVHRGETRARAASSPTGSRVTFGKSRPNLVATDRRTRHARVVRQPSRAGGTPVLVSSSFLSCEMSCSDFVFPPRPEGRRKPRSGAPVGDALLFKVVLERGTFGLIVCFECPRDAVAPDDQPRHGRPLRQGERYARPDRGS